MYKKRSYLKLGKPINKFTTLKILVYIITGIITVRLFYLQVIRHDFYQEVAAKEHYGYTELPARRGDIFIKDYASDELIRVATNITLDTLFADPTIITNKKIVADRLAPLIYDPQEAKTADEARMEEERKKAKTKEELDKIKPLTDEELYKQFYDDLLSKISQEVRSQITLSNDLTPDTLKQISDLNLTGIEVTAKEVLAYPLKITDRNYVASALSKYLNMSPNRLEQVMEGKNRYVILKKKLKPEISAEIQKLINEDKEKNFFGIGLKEEYYRFYPEKSLAANVLGFVTPQGTGTYGIEDAFDIQLKGKPGSFKTQKDGSIYSRQITVGDSEIQPAVDGDNVVLTIDRSMQMTIEKMLAKAVKDYRADSGQVIVLDPKTGRVMAMAHYPSFDPNNFGNVFDTEEVALSADDVKNLVPIEGQENTFWFYRNVIAEDRYLVLREQKPDGSYIYKRYTNWIGQEAYQNKIVSAPYEPGSVFKAITMASAIDDKDVTPNTAINDPGVLKVDEFEIKNVSAKCTGYVTMTRVLENSCNTGVSWVAQQMGRNLFYSYMIKFGFGERTQIEFNNEQPGKIEHFTHWADSELVTHAFGQGITVTPLQMAEAYGVIANKGILMQPHILEEVIQNNGKVVQTENKPIQTVISEQTANTMTAMLVNAVENGVAKNAGLPDHYLAAKTGTSQTYKHGKPLTGAGTTIASIAGFGPIDNPKFVLLVKLDRPRSSEWADSTSAYLFRDIAAYLYQYLGIPPDKNTG
jgi:cell division protein FtsI/penicillin-binding protein 2